MFILLHENPFIANRTVGAYPELVEGSPLREPKHE
jgi:hypothetical protein